MYTQVPEAGDHFHMCRVEGVSVPPIDCIWNGQGLLLLHGVKAKTTLSQVVPPEDNNYLFVFLHIDTKIVLCTPIPQVLHLPSELETTSLAFSSYIGK